MKIVIATDSFKGTLTANQACEIIAESIADYASDIELVLKPVADGGEGTAQTMIKAANGQWVEQEVTGPLPQMKVKAGFAWFEQDRTALVEMASASGLELLSKEQMNPQQTTTYGTGQLIKAAIRNKPQKILLAVGGSATVDGGIGAAAALGWEFLDQNGKRIIYGGGDLKRIKKITRPEKLDLPQVEVLCDVDNPLCGGHGAARIYGPQKGATAEMVEELEIGLKHLSQIVRDQLGCEIDDVPGAGAAGGLAAGAIAFMDAKLVSGIETIIEQTGLYHEIESADWVITGEGRFDDQSMRGKVVSGVCQAALESKAKVAVLAGSVRVSEDEYRKLGISTAISCLKDGMTVEYACENCRELLGKAAREFAKNFL